MFDIRRLPVHVLNSEPGPEPLEPPAPEPHNFVTESINYIKMNTCDPIKKN
jgi:hypothetical protein